MHLSERFPYIDKELTVPTTKGEKMGKWEELKGKGSGYYKTGDVEPIDLMLTGGMLQDFALGCIIKYAFRNRTAMTTSFSASDMQKIIHYAEMLIAMQEEE